MRLRIVFAITVGLALVVAARAVRQPGSGVLDFMASQNNPPVAQVSPGAGPTPVLVELFTSEGCSSCPPADALLSQLGRMQPVHGAELIVLEEHVDYWDRLGWKDPFSSEGMTQRQSEYANAFGGQQVYTPQMVVDGRAEFVGSSERDAFGAVRTASETAKPAVKLAWTPDGQLAVSIQQLTNATRGETSDIYLAVTEGMLQSNVQRGENSGRELKHDGVVRQLIRTGKIKYGSPQVSSTFAIRTMPEWNRANLRAVIFVQEQNSRRVLAAGEVRFPS